jgi:hypothetical protein
MKKKNIIKPKKEKAAVCGLFCPACTIYIASHEDHQRLPALAKRYGVSAAAVSCDGCRSDQRYAYCATCHMFRCAAEKGIDFCGQCAQHPCPEMRQFQEQKPHRLEIFQAQARIAKVGYEQWFREMSERYSCRLCGTINSTYDLKCWRCGASPSCDFVSEHQPEITAYLAKINK